MRARRRFQPSLESLPVRLAPSSVAVASPVSCLAGAGKPTAAVSPTDATAGSNGVSSDSAIIAVGFFTSLPAAALS